MSSAAKIIGINSCGLAQSFADPAQEATFMGWVPLLATPKRAFLGLFFGVKTACFGRVYSGLATFHDALLSDPTICTVLGSIMRKSA